VKVKGTHARKTENLAKGLLKFSRKKVGMQEFLNV
jgi:hypothetical protein